VGGLSPRWQFHFFFFSPFTGRSLFLFSSYLLLSPFCCFLHHPLQAIFPPPPSLFLHFFPLFFSHLSFSHGRLPKRWESFFLIFPLTSPDPKFSTHILSPPPKFPSPLPAPEDFRPTPAPPPPRGGCPFQPSLPPRSIFLLYVKDSTPCGSLPARPQLQLVPMSSPLVFFFHLPSILTTPRSFPPQHSFSHRRSNFGFFFYRCMARILLCSFLFTCSFRALFPKLP